jgi:hypothetical protein
MAADAQQGGSYFFILMVWPEVIISCEFSDNIVRWM